VRHRGAPVQTDQSSRVVDDAVKLAKAGECGVGDSELDLPFFLLFSKGKWPSKNPE